MAENLKKTVLRDGNEYNINAVHSDAASKVTNALTLTPSRELTDTQQLSNSGSLGGSKIAISYFVNS